MKYTELHLEKAKRKVEEFILKPAQLVYLKVSGK